MLAWQRPCTTTAVPPKEAQRLASEALRSSRTTCSMPIRKKQFWGERLRASSAQTLLSQPELKSAVDRANANATGQAPILEKRLARGLRKRVSEPQAGPAHPDVGSVG